ncbi:NAD(P)-dependent oxidoreductase [Porphyromonadaceae bacterium W3.11]|nr:NAD(P)-dependent oxidoreductase [Porphyromonadaceae bacterium W3.11]
MKNKKIRVLITGAGGNIGRELVKMLARRNNQVEINVFDLNTAANREFFDRFLGKINVYFGDITDPSSLSGNVTKDKDIIFHLASIIPPLANENPKLAYDVNVNGTSNLVNSLQVGSPDAFIVMASSVAVYGDRLKNPYIKVDDPLLPIEDDYYAEYKVQMEEIIQKCTLKWSIFRLAAIMGVTNHVSPDLMFKMPLEQVIEICTPRDTARALLNSIDHVDELNGKIFNLGGGPSCTTIYGDFLQNNFKIYGLGALDFPQHAFATQNFHCGFYEDGDILNDILDFRRDTLDDYYQALRAKTPSIQRWATKGLSKLVKSYLLSKSKPYEAWLNNDEEEMKKYFG